MKSFCCNKVVLSAIVLLHFYFSLATTVNRETLLPSSSTGLSVLQRPRKPHRYVSLASFSNLTDEKISFPRVGPDVLEVDYLSTKLDYCKVSDATVPPLPPSFFSGEALLFFKVMACFKVIDLNDRVRNLVVEMEQLLSDAFVIIKNLHQLKKKYNFKLTYCKRAWLKIKRNQKRFFQSSPLARTYNTHLIPSLSAMLVNADLNLLSVKQSEYLQSLEEKTRSRYIFNVYFHQLSCYFPCSFELNRFMGKEIKELQSALYRTEVALRERYGIFFSSLFDC